MSRELHEIMPQVLTLCRTADFTQQGKNAIVSVPDKPSENIPSTPGNALRSSPLLDGIWPSWPAFWRRRSASIHQFPEPEGAHLEIPAPETRVPKHDLKSNVRNHGSCSVFQKPSHSSIVEHGQEIKGYAPPDKKTAKRFSRRSKIPDRARRRAKGMVQPQQPKC